MDTTRRNRMLRLAVASALAGTPLALIGHLAHAKTEGLVESFIGNLKDGTPIMATRQDHNNETVHVFTRAGDDSYQRLPDGKYALDDGYEFVVKNGTLDYDAAVPDGYAAWKEVVATPPNWLGDVEKKILDYALYNVGGDDYAAIQWADGKGYYQAYLVKDDKLIPLSDGQYPLPQAGGSVHVSNGHIVPDSVPGVLRAAFGVEAP
jgi:hypothetical protein